MTSAIQRIGVFVFRCLCPTGTLARGEGHVMVNVGVLTSIYSISLGQASTRNEEIMVAHLTISLDPLVVPLHPCFDIIRK
jgi:hypothetical protein